MTIYMCGGLLRVYVLDSNLTLGSHYFNMENNFNYKKFEKIL